MTGTNQELNHSMGASAAPQAMPEQIRLTMMATVTERLIALRRQEPDAVKTFELSRLIPAAQWLTGEAEGGSGAKH